MPGDAQYEKMDRQRHWRSRNMNMNFQALNIIFRIRNTLLPINCLEITAIMQWPMGVRCQRRSEASWINEFPRYRLSILYSDAKDILYYIMNKPPTINNYCTMQRGIIFPYTSASQNNILSERIPLTFSNKKKLYNTR